MGLCETEIRIRTCSFITSNVNEHILFVLQANQTVPNSFKIEQYRTLSFGFRKTMGGKIEQFAPVRKCSLILNTEHIRTSDLFDFDFTLSVY